jgi:hypothetical protein
MKKLLFAAAIACLALFTSCEKQGVPHTGDTTGNLYGVWALDTKTEVTGTGDKQTTNTVDYTACHFYLTFGEFPFPHAIAKKGSFTEFDLEDVDVDAVTFTYNANQSKITFNKRLWLSDSIVYHMILDGTFDVLELTDKKFVLRQTNLLGGTTTYAYHRYK